MASGQQGRLLEEEVKQKAGNKKLSNKTKTIYFEKSIKTSCSVSESIGDQINSASGGCTHRFATEDNLL